MDSTQNIVAAGNNELPYPVLDGLRQAGLPRQNFGRNFDEISGPLQCVAG